MGAGLEPRTSGSVAHENGGYCVANVGRRLQDSGGDGQFVAGRRRGRFRESVS
jgi:hypothetical protein